MEKQGYILIKDDPFTIKQITEYLNNNAELKYMLIDMDLLIRSISNLETVIVFIDIFFLGRLQLENVLSHLPKKGIVIITSIIPLEAYPTIKKGLSKFKLYELNKPFSEENFIRCINKVITEQNFR